MFQFTLSQRDLYTSSAAMMHKLKDISRSMPKTALTAPALPQEELSAKAHALHPGDGLIAIWRFSDDAKSDWAVWHGTCVTALVPMAVATADRTAWVEYVEQDPPGPVAFPQDGHNDTEQCIYAKVLIVPAELPTPAAPVAAPTRAFKVREGHEVPVSEDLSERVETMFHLTAEMRPDNQRNAIDPTRWPTVLVGPYALTEMYGYMVERYRGIGQGAAQNQDVDVVLRTLKCDMESAMQLPEIVQVDSWMVGVRAKLMRLEMIRSRKKGVNHQVITAMEDAFEDAEDPPWLKQVRAAGQAATRTLERIPPARQEGPRAPQNHSGKKGPRPPGGKQSKQPPAPAQNLN